MVEHCENDGFRVALVHGYLLRGTGSNVYVCNLAKALCAEGFPVTLFSQDPDPGRLDFVSQVVEYRGDKPHLISEKGTPYPGSCRAVKPDIGPILGVYVRDKYRGFIVREFAEMTSAQLDRYLRGNVSALESEFSEFPPRVIISNHSVMQPAYVARARHGRGRHLAILHGSALNFTVKGDSRITGYALEGLRDADVLAAPSEYSVRDLSSVLPQLGEVRVNAVPPGVDLEVFVPRPTLGERQRDARRIPGDILEGLRSSVRSRPGGRGGEVRERMRAICSGARSVRELEGNISELGEQYDSWAPDPELPETLASLTAGDEIILYFGKFLHTKGLRILLAALPLVMMRRPRARVVAVGFGEDRERIEAGIELLHLGRRDLFEEFFLSRDDTGYLDSLVRHLSDPELSRDYYRAARGSMRRHFLTTGILEQDELGSIAGFADISVAPSIFPEAFGLVGAEALAAGVLPVLTAGSGFEEVSRVFREEFSDLLGEEANLDPLPRDEDLPLELASRMAELLGSVTASSALRREIGERARTLAERHFSWRRAARDLLNVSLPGGGR
ncbi:MAG: glycosyltransferase family 4 protein [Bacillota bacterium]